MEIITTIAIAALIGTAVLTLAFVLATLWKCRK